MKKLFNLVSFLVLVILAGVFQACGEDDPLPIEQNTVLLAGNQGQSKRWMLTKLEEREGTQGFQEVNLVGCFTDNFYDFYNNSDQTYEGREGASKCNPSNPDIIERGSWFLTFDAKLVIISANEIFSNNGLFFLLAFPATIKTLTESELVIEMDLTSDDGKFTIRLSFNTI